MAQKHGPDRAVVNRAPCTANGRPPVTSWSTITELHLHRRQDSRGLVPMGGNGGILLSHFTQASWTVNPPVAGATRHIAQQGYALKCAKLRLCSGQAPRRQ